MKISMRFNRNSHQLHLRHQQQNHSADGIANRTTDFGNNSNKFGDDDDSNSSTDEEEQRTRRRIEQRQSGKCVGASSTTNSSVKMVDEHRTKTNKRREEMAKSERILNSLIEQVRHRNEPLERLKMDKGEMFTESDGDESGKRKKTHKKKSRQTEKEHNKRKKKSHRHSKSRDGDKEEGEKHMKKRKKKRHRHLSAEKEADDDVDDGQRNAKSMEKQQSKQHQPSSLANILAAAPVTFPWLTALGTNKVTETKSNTAAAVVDGNGEETAKSTPKSVDTPKPTTKHHQKKHSKKKSKNRSRSKTYSTSPERRRRVHGQEKGRHRHHHRNDNRPSTSKSPSPLPPFSRQRAFETRRKLIEESWHRRIEHSVRPCKVTTETKRSTDVVVTAADGNAFGESEYTDENGRIDKQKLLEIATRNATRLAMEGKLPKGAELIETIKNKSVEQLVGLCTKLQSDRLLVLKRQGDASSNSESDEERRYSRKYDHWQQNVQRREDREFRNRAVRPAGEPARLSRQEQKEIVRREENTLRLTFPVSSGVQHRIKSNAPTPAETAPAAGPLVRFGAIGPLTSALAKVRTNIPAAYKPLSKPLPLSSPTSSLSSNFQSTSQVQIGPQLPSSSSSAVCPNKPLYSGFVPAKQLDCVDQNVYEIALAASARKEEADSRDRNTQTVLPATVTSAQFIGPVVPNPAVDSILTASRLLNADSVNVAASTSSPTANATTPPKSVFSSSWDRPGHIAAREALLKKVVEQQRKAAEQAKGNIIKDGGDDDGSSESQKRAEQQQQMTTNKAAEMVVEMEVEVVPLTDAVVAAQCQQSSPPQNASSSRLETDQHQQRQSQPDMVVLSSSTPTPQTTSENNRTNDVDAQFKKPALPSSSIVKQTFVPSDSGTSMLWPMTTKKPAAPTELANAMPKAATTKNDAKNGNESATDMEGQGKDFLDRFHTFVEAQVARQKAESALQATILTTALQQKQFLAPREEVATFSSSSSFSSCSIAAMAIPLSSSRPEPFGLTKPQKSIQELVAERVRYTQRLQRDPNDYEARKALARVDKEMSSWAQDSSLPGEFTGHTGARVLSEKELEPSDPRFHAWAKKDQFRTAREINSGIGMKLLQRMGWQPGQGLGRDRAGQLEPLTLDVKADRKGLFSCFERAPTRESVLDSTGKNPISVLMEQCARNHWRNPDFSCVESGPHNNRRYHWKAVLNGVEYAPSLPSSNKKAGKAQVCMVIVEALGLSSN